jgi:PIN domain nuclease of toxin-antitoxin system
MHVADTHALIYHSRGGKSRLGREAKRIFAATEAGQHVVILPSIVLWEVACQIELGRIQPFQNFEHWRGCTTNL